MKRTKIVATIGPASEKKTTIDQMIRAGLNVARLNFSHGSYRHHAMLVRNIRAAAKKNKRAVAIMQDLQGPRIRVSDIGKRGIAIRPGQHLALFSERTHVALEKLLVKVPVQYSRLTQDVKVGHTILIDDARVELTVTGRRGGALLCTVRSGENIGAHKGLNFPNSSIHSSAITAKDKADLKFGITQHVDFIALSFVKSAADVLHLRRLIEHEEGRQPRTGRTKIIAKIERPEALKNFKHILEAADGIMIARGDLGLETPIAKVPLRQKELVELCIQAGKPVIVATQMLDSMIVHPVPTRAEVSDVANAILDSTDGIMLSGETATGQYPLAAVKIMNSVADATEGQEINQQQRRENIYRHYTDPLNAIAFAAQDSAERVQAAAIVCMTLTGGTAQAVARYRSVIPVIALTSSEKTYRQLSLSWGVTPFLLNVSDDMPLNRLVNLIRQTLLGHKVVRRGAMVVIASSQPFGPEYQANMLTIQKM